MRKIGEGYYYHVYDLGNGRVMKKQTSHITRVKKLFVWHAKTWFDKVRIILEYPFLIWQEYRSPILSQKISALDPELFGNPLFVDKSEYEQDKALVLADYFTIHTLAENQVRFDEYCRLLHKLWRCSVSDAVYNFTINTGISLCTNQLICIDFNEFTRSKEKVKEYIHNEKWRTQPSLRDMPAGELKSYILSKMAQEITLENLEKYWKV